MLDALYIRQSVERADSVSIESQLTLCRFETKGNPYREYVDRGFSGKDTHRPGFEALIRDIRKGEIVRVIVPLRHPLAAVFRLLRRPAEQKIPLPRYKRHRLCKASGGSSRPQNEGTAAIAAP